MLLLGLSSSDSVSSTVRAFRATLGTGRPLFLGGWDDEPAPKSNFLPRGIARFLTGACGVVGVFG